MEFSAKTDKNFCLQKNSDGELKLKTDHQYYYQVGFVLSMFMMYAIILMYNVT